MRINRLVYPYHFAALTLAAAGLLAAGHEYRPHDPLVAAAVYGTLYSSVTTITLRERRGVRRNLSFVIAAAVLSSLNFSASYYGGRWLGWSTPIDYLVICAGAGAVAYVLLLRSLLMIDLPLRALLWVAPVSVVAVVAVYLTGLHSRNIDALAVGWWFGISVGLWCEDRLSTRVFQTGIH